MPSIVLAADSVKTFGPCSPVAPYNSGSITINCQGLSKQQSEQIQEILNKILTEKLDFNAVMRKLDEVLHEVNPNAPKTTYTFDGSKRVISPGRNKAYIGEAYGIYNKLGQLEQARDWDGLLKLSEEQMQERPTWLTPYVLAGEAYLQLGQREKARELLETAETRIAGNPDYEPLNRPLTEMLKTLRGR